MRKRSKVIFGGAAIAAILAIAGIAYAAFQYTPIAGATGQAETFNETTVTISNPAVNLLPGENTGVTLALNNPAGNGNAKVISITPVGVDVVQSTTQSNTSTSKSQCEGWVQQSTPAAGQIIAGGDTANVPAIIAFDPAMTIECEGMSYTAKWQVTFQAVH